jgi:hypothetical protein
LAASPQIAATILCQVNFHAHLQQNEHGESIVQGTISSGGRLDRALAESCPPDAALSRERIKALIGKAG